MIKVGLRIGIRATGYGLRLGSEGGLGVMIRVRVRCQGSGSGSGTGSGSG